jgi:Tol biopolymer transport system component
MRQRKLYTTIVTCIFFITLASSSACSQPPAATENKPAQNPAEFEVGAIAFEPPEVIVGDTVKINTNIKNVGGITGTYSAVLTIDGQPLDKKEITLMPEQTSTVEFTAPKLTAGKHTVSIGESNISIEVLPKLSKMALARYSGDYYSWDICTMNSDGTDIENITNNAAVDLHPTWSADGMKIAFQSKREPQKRSSIYIMDADGKNVQCLTPEPRIYGFPAWSPDGKKIAYCIMKAIAGGGGASTIGGEEIGPDSIFIMNADGSDKQYVTNGWAPSWFADSQRIAFMSSSTGVWEIHSININGSDIRKHHILPKARIKYGLPLPSCEFPMLAVSPDGGSIVFEYFDYTTATGQDIYILKIDTDEVRNLTSKYDGYKYTPTWSPDGTKIAFTLDTINGNGIYVMNADGSNLTRLIENGLWSTWQR